MRLIASLYTRVIPPWVYILVIPGLYLPGMPPCVYTSLLVYSGVWKKGVKLSLILEKRGEMRRKRLPFLSPVSLLG